MNKDYYGTDLIEADLIPNSYDDLYRALSRRAPAVSLRSWTTRAFIEYLHVAIAGHAHDRQRTVRFIDQFDESNSIITADRFSSRWGSREDLVARIAGIPGHSSRTADVAVSVIELRTDSTLSSHGRLRIEGVADIEFAIGESSGADKAHAATTFTFETLWAPLKLAQLEAAGLLAHYRRTDFYLAVYDRIRFFALVRAPVQYRITYHRPLHEQPAPPANDWQEFGLGLSGNTAG